MEGYRLKDISIKTLLVIIVFFPSFFGYTSLGTGQSIYLIIISFCLFFIFLLNRICKIKSIYICILLLFTLQSFLYLITLLLGGIQGTLVFRDYLEPIRPFIYAAFFSCPILLNYGNIRTIVFLRKLMLFSIFFDLIKFFPFVFPLLCFYTPFDFASVNYIRFSGTFGFCYNFGFIMLFFFSYSLFERSSKIKRTLLLIIITMLIMLTGSRSIIAAFFFLLILYCVLYINGLHRKIGYIVFLFISFFLLYTILREFDTPLINATLQYVERLIDAMFGDASDGSLDTRQSQLDVAISYLKQNVLFGVGPLKGVNEPIEMLFGYYLSSWGIIGCSLYVWSVLMFLFFSYKCFHSVTIISDFSKANFFWILTIPIAGMSSPITDQVRVFNLFYFIQGIQVLFYLKIKYEKTYLQ